MEHCRFSFDEAWALPVVYRKWFIARKDRENKKRAEEEGHRSKRPPPAKLPPAKKR